MDYLAIFDIDGGVSHGFGLKSADHYKTNEKISADNPQNAYKNAMGLAEKFADDALSNPETGLTKVSLVSLIGPEGAVSFDATKSIVKRTMLDHVITTLLASHPVKNEPGELKTEYEQHNPSMN